MWVIRYFSPSSPLVIPESRALRSRYSVNKIKNRGDDLAPPHPIFDEFINYFTNYFSIRALSILFLPNTEDLPRVAVVPCFIFSHPYTCRVVAARRWSMPWGTQKMKPRLLPLCNVATAGTLKLRRLAAVDVKGLVELLPGRPFVAQHQSVPEPCCCCHPVEAVFLSHQGLP